LATPIERASAWLHNPAAWAWISAPFFALLAIWIGLSHGPWIVLFAAIALAWALLVWLVFLPSWQNWQPLAQKFKPRVDLSDLPLALWTSVGGVRLPLDLGGLNASWPLARFSVDVTGISVSSSTGLPFVPPLHFAWTDVSRIEAVSRRAFRIRLKSLVAAILAFALNNRDRVLDVADPNGVEVERSPQPSNWWSPGA